MNMQQRPSANGRHATAAARCSTGPRHGTPGQQTHVVPCHTAHTPGSQSDSFGRRKCPPWCGAGDLRMLFALKVVRSKFGLKLTVPLSVGSGPLLRRCCVLRCCGRVVTAMLLSLTSFCTYCTDSMGLGRGLLTHPVAHTVLNADAVSALRCC